MNNKNNNYEKGQNKAAHNNENKKVVLDKDMYKNDQNKEVKNEDMDEEGDRSRSSK